MIRKILVTYATRHGSTAEVAEVIAQELRQSETTQVDVCPIEQVSNLAPYEAVVIGSAVHINNWLPEAVSFVKEHKAELEKVPTAYFTTCFTMQADTNTNRATAASYLKAVRDMLKPMDEAYFAGKLSFKQLSLFERFMLRLRGAKEGDYRNWTAIRGWANTLRARLQQS